MVEKLWYEKLAKFFSRHVHSDWARSLGKSKKMTEEIETAIRFSGMDLEIGEVYLTSFLLAIIVFILIIVPIAIFIVATNLYGIVINEAVVILLYLLPIIVPFIVFIYFLNYPKYYANILKIRAHGKMAEVVSYLTMSMRLTPSLDRAVSFACEHIDKPFSTALKKVLWEVYTRKYDTIEKALTAFADEWGEWNEDFKRAIYTVVSAQLEQSSEGLRHTLQRANDIILEGTKRMLEEYQAKLSGPTFILFSLGLLLPVIVGTMLPLAGMGGIKVSVLEVIFLMNVLFPIGTFLYAYNILRNRPAAITPPQIPSIYTSGKKILIFFIAIMVGLSIFVLTFLLGAFLGIKGIIGGAAATLAIGIAIGLYSFSTSFKQKMERERILEVEKKYPDALFQFGNRIAEGKPFEVALKKVSEEMKGSQIADEMRRLSYIIYMKKLPPEEALFGYGGALVDYPSKTIKTTMKVAGGTAKKDILTAGQTIVSISSYLRDMRKVEHDIRIGLSSIVTMMVNTAMFFAPIMIGITSAIYVILAEAMKGMIPATEIAPAGIGFYTAGGVTIPVDVFSGIFGLYLVLTVIIVTYFSVGIMYGDDAIERNYTLGKSLPIAVIIYALCFILGQAVL